MVVLITIFIYLPIVGCERITYQNFYFLGIIHRKNATAFKKKRSNGDHLGNIRLSYSDANNNGTIEVTSNPLTTEIVEENNYYPFGLRHKGYNNVVVSEHPYKYNGVELEESLGLDLYEMEFRQYDPAIARFTSIDPITHYSKSTYNAFDNNPIFFADPSGANSESWLLDLFKNSESGTTYTNNNDGTFSGSDGSTVNCDECKKLRAERKELNKTINELQNSFNSALKLEFFAEELTVSGAAKGILLGYAQEIKDLTDEELEYLAKNPDKVDEQIKRILNQIIEEGMSRIYSVPKTATKEDGLATKSGTI